MRNKDAIFDSLDILNSINMEYETYQTKCSHCKILGTGNVQFDCNQPGYCPAFLSQEKITLLNSTLISE